MAKKILIVDDEQSILDMTELVLEKRGYDISTALNGVAALEKVNQNKPDIILTDVLMPEMDGFHFYKELRKNNQTAEIPVLVVTARGLMEDSFKALGAEDFIVKPFTPEELIEKIEEILNSDRSNKPSQEGIKRIIRKKILLASSQSFVYNRATVQTNPEEYQIEWAKDADALVSKVDSFLPDLVLVDIYINDFATDEIILKLRNSSKFEKIPIIAFCHYNISDLNNTAMRRRVLSNRSTSRRCLRAGADMYIGRFNEQIYVKTLSEVFHDENILYKRQEGAAGQSTRLEQILDVVFPEDRQESLVRYARSLGIDTKPLEAPIDEFDEEKLVLAVFDAKVDKKTDASQNLKFALAGVLLVISLGAVIYYLPKWMTMARDEGVVPGRRTSGEHENPSTYQIEGTDRTLTSESFKRQGPTKRSDVETMDGVYKEHDKNGVLQYEYLYKKGKLVWKKTYNKRGILKKIDQF